ncbi:MAG: metallophosphoesterase [Candidatus Sericytochromatia bacterium]|nr:metallophosphoesterase [Candidatus Sericytochromatia bacterium]
MWLTLDDRWGFRLGHHRVPCPALPRPLRILHLSDAHLLSRDTAKQAFIRQVTDDNYDLVCFTGDVAEDEDAEHLVPGLLSRMPRLGAYIVLGNHDRLRQPRRVMLEEFLTQRFTGKGQRPPTAQLKARYEDQARWRVLVNETVLHEVDGCKVAVVGVDDPFTGQGNLAQAMRGLKQADVLIGLVHVPTDLASFSQRSFHLVLSGHTHGGQIRLPGVGAVVTQCDLPRRHARGVHWVERTAVHVSEGLGAGTLIRLRVNCPPRAHVIELGG